MEPWSRVCPLAAALRVQVDGGEEAGLRRVRVHLPRRHGPGATSLRAQGLVERMHVSAAVKEGRLTPATPFRAQGLVERNARLCGVERR